MDVFVGILIGILEQGLIYSILAMGVYITYQILDFPDLTVDGTFALGGAIGALFLTNGHSPAVALLVALLSGAVAGMVTGVIHTKFRIRNLLSSILTMTALYSVNSRVAGTSNVQLFTVNSMFKNSYSENLKSIFGKLTFTVIILFIVIIVKLAIDFYLKTKSGMLLRATGDNKQIVTSLGKSYGLSTIIGLMIANGLVALGGSILVQQQRYFDISMGTGTVVICLASVIIGVSFFKKINFIKDTTKVIFGAIIYKAVISLVLFLTNKFNLKQTDLQMFMTIVFLLVLISNNFSFKVKKNA